MLECRYIRVEGRGRAKALSERQLHYVHLSSRKTGRRIAMVVPLCDDFGEDCYPVDIGLQVQVKEVTFWSSRSSGKCRSGFVGARRLTLNVDPNPYLLSDCFCLLHHALHTLFTNCA